MYVCVCVYIPSILRLPLLPHLTPLGHHRTPGWAPCVIQQLPTIYFTRDSVYMSIRFVPPSPSPTLPTNRFSTGFMSTSFLDSIYMH